MSHVLPSHVACINESCLTYQRVMSHISTSHVSHINESCLTHQRVMSHTSTSHVSRITKSCRMYPRVMSHTSTSHVSNINESYRTCPWVMSHTSTSHVSHINESCLTYQRVMPLISISHAAHVHESLLGSLILQVSFAKELCKRDYILQKRPIIPRSLLIIATVLIHLWHDTSSCSTSMSECKNPSCHIHTSYICDMTHSYTHSSHPRSPTHSRLIKSWHGHDLLSCSMPPTYHGQNWSYYWNYGVATMSRLLKIIGLLCKRAL